MLHIAICDDMTEESAVLVALLEEYAQIHHISIATDVFANGFLFLEEISKKKQYQLCFLDIFMPSFTGLDTAKELRNLDTEMCLIFCTSSTKFALDGYGVQASNYLVKPVKKDKIFSAMDQILLQLQQEKENVLWFQTGSGIQKISHAKIAYGEPEVNFSRLILRDGSSLFCRLTFSDLCENLGKFHNFSLISRSVLLNYDAVMGMVGEDFLLENQEKLPIPRRKKKDITQAFLDYTMAQN